MASHNKISKALKVRKEMYFAVVLAPLRGELCLFVIPGACDFVVWCFISSSAKNTTKEHEHKTNPHEGRAGRDESSILMPDSRLRREGLGVCCNLSL